MKKKLLFLCIGNSCRSQIAEGLGKKYLKSCQVSSAGTTPEKVNHNAINSMEEIGIDISMHKSTKINYNKLNKFDLIITLCRDARDSCPTINLSKKHIHWDIEDPAKFNGTDNEIKAKFSEIRDIIYQKIKSLKIELKKEVKIKIL